MATNKDFGLMRQNVGVEVGDTSSDFAARVSTYINNRYRDMVDRLQQADVFEKYRTWCATTTSGTRDYVLPSDFEWPVHVIDYTNSRNIDVITEEEWAERFGSAPSTQGAPIVMIMKAQTNVRTQPSSATKLRIVSSETGDTTQSVFIRAISGSAEFYESLTLNGTTSAASVNTYDYYLSLSLSNTASGAITLSYVTGSEVAAVISTGNKESRYRRAGFHYVPAGSYEIEARYQREIEPLTQTNDTPILDISDGIELGAKADAWRTKRFFANAADFETLYERWIDRYVQHRFHNLIHQCDVKPDNRNNTYA